MNSELDYVTCEPQMEKKLDALEQQVQCRLTNLVRDFRVSLRDRGLVLQGRARTYYAKQLAQHVVMNAIDLPIQANEIEVM